MRHFVTRRSVEFLQLPVFSFGIRRANAPPRNGEDSMKTGHIESFRHDSARVLDPRDNAVWGD